MTYLLLAMLQTAQAQVLPPNRTQLNYRLIGFSVPEKEGVTGYEFDVEEVIITDTGKTVYQPVFKKMSDNHQLIATVPGFGKTYRWEVHYYKGKEIAETSPKYMFSTGYSMYTDTSKYRLHVTKNETRDNNMYILVDATKTIYDLDGTPIWYLPEIPGVNDDNTNIRDLKITPQNTITFLTEKNAYEIDYNGDVLWKAPNNGIVSGDSIEYYHHEFTRLKNGNYMVAGNEHLLIPVPASDSDSYKAFKPFTFINNKPNIKTECGTLIEYSPSGKVVWSWKSSGIFTNDFFLKHAYKSTDRRSIRTHLNAFYFDQKNQVVYLSYRDVSSIIKIKYPSGQKIRIYGQLDSTNNEVKGTFYGQHNCSITNSGQLSLYNNNILDNPNSDKTASLLLIQEPNTNNDDPELFWEFRCKFDNNSNSEGSSGGNMTELPGDAFLVSMGSASKLFILMKNKDLVWEANVQNKKINGDWQNILSYRVSPLSNTDSIHEIIFNSKYTSDIKK
ncbi:MAG: aryl-sulfate sulfotransferase [Chitinophagales bacterium]|nr:aryl-sulfate sulfotransferase [Chitinophagales bacterium]